MNVSRETSAAARVGVAREVAERAGAILRDAWGADTAVSYKGEVDLVTSADHASEALIVEQLHGAFPDDTIVAEEGRGHEGSPDRVWYVDPLDGTTNFSHGLPHFAVSVAYCDELGPAVGVVFDPIRRWAFHARRGHGAWLDGQRLRSTHLGELGRALLATGFPANRRRSPDNNIAEAAHVVARAQGIRRAGSAALDLAYVAAGWLDGFWEPRLAPWDMAAGALLVTEAGGLLSLASGAPFGLHTGSIVAAGPKLHPALLEHLTAARATAGLPTSQ